MIPRDPSLRRPAVFANFLAAFLAVPMGAPAPARAAVQQVQALPSSPTTCDRVSLVASGYLPSPGPCYEIVGAGITGPEPSNPLCMAPICPARFEIRIYVRGPSPDSACVAVIQPYTRSFSVGPLAAGAYAVRATELVLPYGSDSTGVPVDSSSVSLLFFVTKAETCPPQLSCVLLDFASTGTATTLLPPPKTAGRLAPAPSDSFAFAGCTATAAPGGTACLDLRLHNEVPISRLETEIAVFDPLAALEPGGPVPSGEFIPVSITAAGRASGFQVEWSASDRVARVTLSSTSGGAVPAGDGPVLRLCYRVAPQTRPGPYAITHWNDVVLDAGGASLPPCPTFRETSGRICVVAPGCDIDGRYPAGILDIVQIVRCALGPVGGPGCPDSIAARADCDGDGTIDLSDAACCARKILLARAAAGNYPVQAAFQDSNSTTFGFEGPIRWITPAEGRVRLVIHPSVELGGADWCLTADPARIRIHDLALLGPGGYHLEWVGSPDGSRAYAMLFQEGAVDPAQPIVMEVAIDRVGEVPAPTELQMQAFEPVTLSGHLVTSGAAAWTLTVAAGGLTAPAVFHARPNPFSAETEIAFSLPAPGRVTLRIYDVTGRLVRTLVSGPAEAGVRRVTWNGKDEFGRQARSGIYFVRLEAAGVLRTARLLRLR